MSAHRLTSLKHRCEQFERRIGLELRNMEPDQEALDFFEAQKTRINALIDEIEAMPGDRLPKANASFQPYEAVAQVHYA